MNDELDRATILMMLKIDFLFNKTKYIDKKRFTVYEINMINNIINSFEKGVKSISLYNEKIAEYFMNFGCVVTKQYFNANLQCHLLKVEM